MFNKDQFKTKLEFAIRNMYELQKEFNSSPVFISEFFATSLIVMWQTRNTITTIDGIDEPEKFELFKKVIAIGLLQLDAKVAMLTQGCQTNGVFFVSLNIAIGEAVNELANDIEELLK